VIQPFPKQPRSEDLIRHRKYNLCVVCEEREAISSNFEMLVRIPESEEDAIITAVATKWWTCQKCEEGQ
jgi:hypothetical protein